MQLAEYLEGERMSLTAFAEKIETSVETVRRYRDGERVPNRENMAKVVAATGGKVQPNDFFDTPSPPGEPDDQRAA